VIVVTNPNLVDLSLMGWQKEFVAENGRRGGSGRKRGKTGKDLAISVPVGTMVFTKAKSGEEILLADLRTPGQKVLVAKGGRGGLGNARFATAVNQAPEIASKGAHGEERYIILEVKLITDICIVGHPNSGKSTLLAAISRAKPEIADYPFTTRQPILGVMSDNRRDFVVAEIPGLVEGAHLGKGLGNEFLRHVERTRLLIYLLDGSSPTVIDDLSTLDKEIALYKGLSQKPKIVAVNKIDLPEVQARLPEVKQCFAKLGVPVFYISALSGQAVLELTRKAMEMVDQASRDEEMISQAQITVFRPKPRK
jgi:GTP-binding protein